MSTQIFSNQYDDVATETGRHAGQAVVLLVGHSGHGKSTTINRLVGTDLLEVAEDGSGSTTKVIQRVEVKHTSTQSGVTVNIAFDDTPGDSDTVFADGVVNYNVMDVYKSRHFPDTGGASGTSIYPNVILLVVSWDSVVEDAHNAPGYFTSAAGKTMQALSSSGLVDHSRPNVVVVVTKSMSSWKDLVDDTEDSGLDPRDSWMLQAQTRKDIIVGLQRKISPAIPTAWDVVFVENGCTREAAYPRLPNGEWSHQNLFDAISKLIRRPGAHGRADFGGMHALDFLTGVAVEETRAQIKTRVLVSKDDLIGYNRAHNRPFGSPVARPSRYQALTTNLKEQQIAEEFLGVTYNPLSGTFGRSCVLDLGDSDVRFTGGRDCQQEDFVKESADENAVKSATASKLQIKFSIPDLVTLDAYWHGAAGEKFASHKQSIVYVAQHTTRVITVSALKPKLSQEMLGIISDLGRWTGGPSSREKYYDFFSNHGTHVVLRLALGGKLRIARWDDTKNAGQRKKREFGAGMNFPKFPFGGNAKHTKNEGVDDTQGDIRVRISREGGADVAQDLTDVLETLARSSTSADLSADKLEWPNVDIRKKWISALQVEPAFCRGAEDTGYMEICSLGGLELRQTNDLRDALKSYLTTRHDKQNESPAWGAGGGQKDDMNRQRNHRGVMNWFHKIFTGRKGHKV